jgi:hypothetical protein
LWSKSWFCGTSLCHHPFTFLLFWICSVEKDHQKTFLLLKFSSIFSIIYLFNLINTLFITPELLKCKNVSWCSEGGYHVFKSLFCSRNRALRVSFVKLKTCFSRLNFPTGVWHVSSLFRSDAWKNSFFFVCLSGKDSPRIGWIRWRGKLVIIVGCKFRK